MIELKDLQAEKERMERIVEEAKNRETTTSVNPSELEDKVNKKIATVIDAIDDLPIVEAKSLVQKLVEKVVVYEEKNIEIVLLNPS